MSDFDRHPGMGLPATQTQPYSPITMQGEYPTAVVRTILANLVIHRVWCDF